MSDNSNYNWAALGTGLDGTVSDSVISITLPDGVHEIEITNADGCTISDTVDVVNGTPLALAPARRSHPAA